MYYLIRQLIRYVKRCTQKWDRESYPLPMDLDQEAAALLHLFGSCPKTGTIDIKEVLPKTLMCLVQ